jgi:hypothetical protein
MDSQVRNNLARIGAGLDRHAFPRVTNGGFVVLNEPPVSSNSSTETSHGKGQTGSAAGSRPRAARREGAPRGPWTSGAPAPIVGANPEARYEAELGGLGERYPSVQLSRLEHGLWLLTKSGLLPGLRENAIFLTGVSFPGRVVRSWAFWGAPLAYPVWIGPRHTNFPDGSVCAFEPADGTWQFGQSLVTLLDLFTVWAVRHLYLREFGRWPGYQSIHFPGERILELRPDEHCGCSNSEKLYGQCCMPSDLSENRIAHCLNFFRQTGGSREPPEVVVDYVRFQKGLPSLADLVTAFAPSYVQLT